MVLLLWLGVHFAFAALGVPAPGAVLFFLQFRLRSAILFMALPVTVGGQLPDRGQLLAP